MVKLQGSACESVFSLPKIKAVIQGATPPVGVNIDKAHIKKYEKRFTLSRHRQYIT